MPELPEVETVRRILERHVVGKTITDVTVDPDFPAVLESTMPADAVGTLFGLTIHSIHRRGKYLLLHLDDGLWCIVHLRMTGRLLVLPTAAPPATFEHLALHLDDGNDIRFADQRKFGRVTLATDEAIRHLDRKLGIEPLSRGFTSTWLHQRLASRPGKIKAVLLDQHLIAGLGNIYVDEALYDARIHPASTANALSETDCRRLTRSIRKVLRGAIEHRGTSFSTFETPYGEPGDNVRRLQVYGKGRDSAPCPRCGTEIERLVIGGRGTSACPVCQRLILPSAPPRRDR